MREPPHVREFLCQIIAVEPTVKSGRWLASGLKDHQAESRAPVSARRVMDVTQRHVHLSEAGVVEVGIGATPPGVIAHHWWHPVRVGVPWRVMMCEP